MDTKTPPIPLKHHEKHHHHQPAKKPERAADLSLPPLTPYPNQRPKQKPPGSSWLRDASCTVRYQEHHRKRPYRVLHIGATPLMHACQQADRTRVLRLLKEQEETIGFRDRTLRTALHYCMDAATGGAVAAAAPELVNAADAEGHTPLHLAVIAGDTQLVAVLLANGADVNAKDLEGHSVLHWATVCGEAECVRLVLAAGARPSTPDLRGGSPLHYAAQCCGAAATAELAVPKKVGLKVLQTLLEFGADVNAKDEDGRQPILWAASAGSVEAVLALARAGGSAAAGASDKDGLTALHCAASRGHVKCIEALVNLCGSQPDHVDDNGCSALHYAATLGQADATALILKLGANPNRQDRKGRTPALCAAAKGQLETLKILAQHGGSLHARSVRGTGVAHEAVASGRLELIKWLAKKRPSTLDVMTQDGKTPLHVAALHGHLDVCKVLLDHGAKINAVLRTSKGSLMTALDAALYRGHRDCAKLIQMHGGVTAQHIRTQKTAPNKVFAANLRVKQTESSTDTESSPRKRGRGKDHPDLYYEERWIERRTRRRGSLRKLTRRDSRSFSEEEVRLSKKSVKRDPQRRTRSESARYDSEDEDSERKLRKRRSKKRSSKYTHDYSESSIESESVDRSQDDLDESGTIRTVIRRKTTQERRRGRSKDKKDSSNGSDGRDRDLSKKSDDDRDVSDDSLEVVVVKKSIEKCEKLVSGKRSKTPSEQSSREPKLTKARRRSSKRKSRSGEKVRSSDRDKDAKESFLEMPRMSASNGEQEEARYHRDVTDSTSQETVERVVVTAMVHKDQAPDTPKSNLELSKEVTFSDVIETAERKKEVDGARDNSDLEKHDDVKQGTQESLISRAVDLKRNVEELKQSSGQKSKDDVRAEDEIVREADMKDDGAEGRLDTQQTSESQTENSTETSPSRASVVFQSKLDKQEDKLLIRDEAESAGTPAKPGKDEDEHLPADVTPRTVVQDVPASDTEDTSKQDERQASKDATNEAERTNETESSQTVETKNGRKQATESEKSSSAEKSGGSSKSESKSVSLEKEETEGQKETAVLAQSADKLLALPTVGSPVKETAEDKEQADSARGKSLDLSSESRNSALEEDDGGSLRTDTPIDQKQVSGEEGDRSSPESKKSGEETVQEAKTVGGKHDGAKGGPMKDAESFRYIDESSSSSPRSSKVRHSRPSTGRVSKSGRRTRKSLFESSEERSPDRSAIVAVIDSPVWDEEDEEVEKEIREAIGEEEGEQDSEHEEDDEVGGVVRVLPSTSEEEVTKRLGPGMQKAVCEASAQGQQKPHTSTLRVLSPHDSKRLRPRLKQRRDSGGRDSGIEPSPRVSRIPRRRTTKCCPNTERQQALNMETITRDVQISLRRYHLERKIFFQLMELKRLQIRHGRANEHVLVKRQVDTFHRAGTSGPTLGVAKYDQPFTFRHFEAFLYEQLRKLQRRSATPDFCTEAKQCTQKTHRCHHATSAYTSVPVYTYLGGGAPERADLLPKIESRGRGQMTVEVTHGEEKQVIALPAERLDRTKRYFVTFTVRGETQENEKPKMSCKGQRSAKSV